MKLFRIVVLVISLSYAATAQDFKVVQDGVEYAQFGWQVKINDKEAAPAVVNALRLDLKKVRLDVVHAMDAAIGTEKTSSIAARHGAFAAINAGFFRLDASIFKGDAAGVLQIDGKILSESYSNRIALLISNDLSSAEVFNPVKGREYFVELKETQLSFQHLDSLNKFIVDEESFQISGINRERKENEIILFTPKFGHSTLTAPDGLEIIIRKNKIVKIRDNKGSSIIPENGFVLSANGAKRSELLQKVKVKKNIKLDLKNFADVFNGTTTFKSSVQVEDIVGGVPQLIKNGKIEITWEQEKSSKSFVETRHPRTAIARLKDGKALLVTVDGRQPGVSVGMNLQELAEMLLEMGATDAMNLDGGGSTTMFLDGKVVNKPSDKEGERAVSDAILVTLRKTK